MASNIVLADAQGSPVNHTFVPIGRDAKGVYWFEDQSQANAIGFWKISMELARPSLPAAQQSSEGRTFRVKIGLHEPLLETVSNNTVAGIAPAPTISYTPRVFTEYILPERSALLDRKNVRKMNANLQAEAQLTAMVENLTYIS
jgi:hypothetical protein